MRVKKIKIFLASSNELQAEREYFERKIYRKCKNWFEREIFMHLDIWEDLSTRMSVDGSQSEYSKLAQAADLFVLLAHTKVGMYTAEEFTTAFGQFQSTKKPFIFTYFKTLGRMNTDPSLVEFHQKLRDLKHFYSFFTDGKDLWGQFNEELDRLKTNGFTEFKHHDSNEKPIINIKNQFISGTFDKTTFN